MFKEYKTFEACHYSNGGWNSNIEQHLNDHAKEGWQFIEAVQLPSFEGNSTKKMLFIMGRGTIPSVLFKKD